MHIFMMINFLAQKTFTEILKQTINNAANFSLSDFAAFRIVVHLCMLVSVMLFTSEK